MSIKSNQCIGRKSRKPLKSYFNLAEAKLAAEHLFESYGFDQIPYECGRCKYWHLSPKSRETPSTKCEWCTSSDGESKSLYSSEQSAQKRADIIYNEERIDLTVYECPHADGWHLTKKF